MSDAVSRVHAALALVDGHVVVEDLGSRNGTVVRSAGPHDELHLRPQVRHVMGRRDTIALPSGITVEISGRSVPLTDESEYDGGAAAVLDDRATRILVTRA